MSLEFVQANQEGYNGYGVAGETGIDQTSPYTLAAWYYGLSGGATSHMFLELRSNNNSGYYSRLEFLSSTELIRSPTAIS